jgi:putative ABC transport system permease protein
MENVANLNPLHATVLLLLSLALTLLGGFIPARLAAKKDPVAALRAE